MAAFWRELNLEEMSREQWESLCDGCARCCLHKLQDDDTDEIFYTNVACELLDGESCRCTDYSNRLQRVPECLYLSPDKLEHLNWLPSTCAYRVLAEGGELADWHPLVSGDPESVHRAGISVRARTVSQAYVHEDAYEDHIIRWVEHKGAEHNI